MRSQNRGSPRFPADHLGAAVSELAPGPVPLHQGPGDTEEPVPDHGQRLREWRRQTLGRGWPGQREPGQSEAGPLTGGAHGRGTEHHVLDSWGERVASVGVAPEGSVLSPRHWTGALTRYAGACCSSATSGLTQHQVLMSQSTNSVLSTPPGQVPLSLQVSRELVPHPKGPLLGREGCLSPAKSQNIW